eukprot:4844755-Pleurochrysis_carterae.AAC.1
MNEYRNNTNLHRRGKRQTCITCSTQAKVSKCDVTIVLPRKLSRRPSVHDPPVALSRPNLVTSFSGAHI